MKIGMFINYYTPSKGGMETSVINLCDGLKKCGHETFVFAPEYPDWEDKEKNIYRYKSVRFKYGGYAYVIPVTFFTKKIDSIVEGLKLDVIHSHQPYSLGEEALDFSKKLNLPLVFTYHIKYEDYSHYIPFVPEKIARKYIKKVTTTYSNKCDAVIAPSTAIKNLLLENGVKSRIEIVPSGIDIGYFSHDKGMRNKIREKYKIGPQDVVLVTASRLTEEKNIKFMVEAFVKVKKSFQNAKFFIVGDGSIKKELEETAKNLNVENDIIFPGLLSKEEIVNFYQAGDIFVFSSLTETQGLVAVEAMASGLPVVAIKASGIEDMVESGKDGFLTSAETEDFSQSILKLATDGGLRRKMAEQAKIDSGKFSIDLWIKKICNLYNSVISNK